MCQNWVKWHNMWVIWYNVWHNAFKITTYSQLQIGWHSILRLFLKTFNFVPGVPGFFGIHNLLPGTNRYPMGRILVCWKRFRNNLEMMCHPICNWLYLHVYDLTTSCVKIESCDTTCESFDITCDTPHSNSRHISFVTRTWDMTHSYAWHEHTCDITHSHSPHSCLWPDDLREFECLIHV